MADRLGVRTQACFKEKRFVGTSLFNRSASVIPRFARKTRFLSAKSRVVLSAIGLLLTPAACTPDGLDAWNMAFGFYQSLRTVPEELVAASRNFNFNAWMRFWRLEVPFAMPILVWIMIMSMSGGWFSVVASEAIVRATRSLPCRA